MKKLGFYLLMCGVLTANLNAQDTNLDAQDINLDELERLGGITTAAPFLLVIPDARSGAMGDVGVATSIDGNSLFHNPSKIVFGTRQVYFAVNYAPWLANLTDDVAVGGISYIRKYRDNNAWGIDFRYFTFGQIDLIEGVDATGNAINGRTVSPNEFSFSGTYSLKLNRSFSMGVSLKYLRSNLDFSGEGSVLGISSFAVDVSGFYQSLEKYYGNFDGRYRLGFNLANVGPKVNYTVNADSESFIPTNLKLGGGFEFILDAYNSVTTTLELTKLLVPTPPIKDEEGEIIGGKDDNVSWIPGIFQSLGDAPGGLSEELKEFTFGLGVEYLYNSAFALRTGYFYESELKGNRKYLTLGTGFKTNALNIDLSYLINTSGINNPLENTLRFSLSFDLGEFYEY